MKLLRSIEARQSDSMADSLEVLAILDGVERLLMGAPHRNPTLSDLGRRQIKTARKMFVMAMVGGLLNEVIPRVMGSRKPR